MNRIHIVMLALSVVSTISAQSQTLTECKLLCEKMNSPNRKVTCAMGAIEAAYVLFLSQAEDELPVDDKLSIEQTKNCIVDISRGSAILEITRPKLKGKFEHCYPSGSTGESVISTQKACALPR